MLPSSYLQTYSLPPEVNGPSGSMRKVGIEIEFAFSEVRLIADTILNLYGGTLEKENDHRYKVSGTPFGIFTVELDTQYAHPAQPSPDPENPLETWLEWEIDKFMHSVVGHVSKTLVPYEIVTPPIPLNRLSEINPLIQSLANLGAEGTNEHPLYAFGLHLNPEVPSLSAESILNHLRAFIVLSDWLHYMMDIDMTRKLSPYINTFPSDYALKILSRHYQPDISALIDDYFEFNPTRNRELDLVPLFLHIDRKRVESLLDDDLSSARPTYHYRLPDCRLNDPDWSLAREWNFWVEVERLAVDSERLRAISDAFIEHQTRWIKWKWIEKAQPWLPQLKSSS